jgi:hypothetical protein
LNGSPKRGYKGDGAILHLKFGERPLGHSSGSTDDGNILSAKAEMSGHVHRNMEAVLR